MVIYWTFSLNFAHTCNKDNCRVLSCFPYLLSIYTRQCEVHVKWFIDWKLFYPKDKFVPLCGRQMTLINRTNDKMSDTKIGCSLDVVRVINKRNSRPRQDMVAQNGCFSFGESATDMSNTSWPPSVIFASVTARLWSGIFTFLLRYFKTLHLITLSDTGDRL